LFSFFRQNEQATADIFVKAGTFHYVLDDDVFVYA